MRIGPGTRALTKRHGQTGIPNAEGGHRRADQRSPHRTREIEGDGCTAQVKLGAADRDSIAIDGSSY